jgi:hypothetical protein
MAIDAKVDFIRQMELELANVVTVSDMTKIMNAVSNVLEGYEMRSVTIWADTKDDMLESYLSALSVECRSEKTLKRYEYVINKLMKFAQVPTRKITVYHLRSFLQNEKERGICDNTLEGYRQIYSAYFNWLQRESLIDRNPTSNLGAIKVAKKEKKVY